MSVLGERLIDIVRRKAAENPGLIYKSPVPDRCVYVHDGKPSCIIGHALLEAGEIDASIEDTTRNSSTFWSRWGDFAMDIDYGESSWLRTVQVRQDVGDSWGGAVAHADSIHIRSNP